MNGDQNLTKVGKLRDFQPSTCLSLCHTFPAETPPLFLSSVCKCRPVPLCFFSSEACCSPAPTGAADFRAAVQTEGLSELARASAPFRAVRRDLGDFDHKHHGVSVLVAERTADHVHGVLVRHSPETLAVHRQQFVAGLQKHKRRMSFDNQRWCFQPPCFPVSSGAFWQTLSINLRRLCPFGRSLIYATEKWGSANPWIYLL